MSKSSKKKPKQQPKKRHLLVLLVGPPASGKTTFRQDYIASNPETKTHSIRVVSSDDALELIAKFEGKTYDQVFSQNAGKANDISMDHFRNSLQWSPKLAPPPKGYKITIIVDRTNLTKKSRARFLSQVSKEWEKVAVVFPVPSEEVWKERLNRPGKFISGEVLKSMLERYEPPAEDEGFDQIIHLGGVVEAS